MKTKLSSLMVSVPPKELYVKTIRKHCASKVNCDTLKKLIVTIDSSASQTTPVESLIDLKMERLFQNMCKHS